MCIKYSNKIHNWDSSVLRNLPPCMSTSVAFSALHYEAECDALSCISSTGELVTGNSLWLAMPSFYLNLWAPGSMWDPLSITKVDVNSGIHPGSTSDNHVQTYTVTISVSIHSNISFPLCWTLQLFRSKSWKL